MIELYLVRHGETSMNEKGMYYGWTDCGLTEKGIKQAQALKNTLSNIKFDEVIASTLIRAIDTAHIISGFDKNVIRTDDRLRELNFGEWEGKHFEDIKESSREHWDKWCSDWMNTAPPLGECFKEFYLRVSSFVEEILKKHKAGRVLLVSHQGSLRIIASLLIKLEIENNWSFAFEQGAYSVFEINNEHCVIKRLNCEAYKEVER